jgi:hypothetical protein
MYTLHNTDVDTTAATPLVLPLLVLQCLSAYECILCCCCNIDAVKVV